MGVGARKRWLGDGWDVDVSDVARVCPLLPPIHHTPHTIHTTHRTPSPGAVVLGCPRVLPLYLTTLPFRRPTLLVSVGFRRFALRLGVAIFELGHLLNVHLLDLHPRVGYT